MASFVFRLAKTWKGAENGSENWGSALAFRALDSSRPLDAETRFACPAQAYGAFCLVELRSRFRPAPVKGFRAMNERSVTAIASRISAFNRIAS